MFSWGELFSTFLVRKIMGVEGTCRSANGGGCPFLQALYISNRHLFTPSTPRVLHHSTISKRYRNRSKVNIYLLDFVSPPRIWRQRKAKSKHLFEKWVQSGCRFGAGGLPFGVSAGCRCQALRGFRTCLRLALVLWWCVPWLCPLFCSALGASLANVALFGVLRAFLGRFGVVVWVCVGLVLCVACVAFVCVSG